MMAKDFKVPGLLALWLAAGCAVLHMRGVAGHGRMILPPSRASAWRLGVPGAPIDYNDNQAYCGGRVHQHGSQGGKCGICGDPWDQAPPRAHERPGGRFVMDSGFILSTFKQGEIIQASIMVTAPHRGYFEFYLCNVDSLGGAVEATHACLHEHKLVNPDTNRTTTDFVIDDDKTYVVRLQLPRDLSCDHCVLQWRWRTGNTWPKNGPQEEFYSCADMRIKPRDAEATPRPPVTTPPAVTPPPCPDLNTTHAMLKAEEETRYLAQELASEPGAWNSSYKHDWLDDAARDFFLCNFCAREVFDNGLTSLEDVPPVCKCIGFPGRACSRRG